MTSKKFNLFIRLLLILLPLNALTQKTTYGGLNVPIAVLPMFPQFKEYSTFDHVMISLLLPADKNAKRYDDLPYDIKVGNLKSAPSGDLHLVTTLSAFNVRLTSKSSSTGLVALNISIYDRYGNLVQALGLNRENFSINFGRALSEEEIKDGNFLNRFIIQNSIDTALRYFNNALTGFSIKKEMMFGSLLSVKDKPELKEFSVQYEAVLKSARSNDATLIINTLKDFVPFWEKMTAYSGEGDANEVKRAAYQNLILYYTLVKDLPKAKEYLELYKPIDKVISAAFGLYKVKYSEQSETYLNELNPVISQPAAFRQTLITPQELLDLEEYLTFAGTITIKGKRKPGNYNGKIKIARMNLPIGIKGSFDTDKPGDNLIVFTNDGQKFSVELEDLASLNVSDSEMYTVKTVGLLMGLGGYSALMKSTYISAKIAVYRSIFPNADYYFVSKTGDTEGYVKSTLKQRKKLAEYLSDCANVSQKIKDGTISDAESEEKIALLYTECK